MDDNNVLYCPECLSLKILSFGETDVMYCGECGCTDIKETDIEDWDKKYQSKYGKKFITLRKRFIY